MNLIEMAEKTLKAYDEDTKRTAISELVYPTNKETPCDKPYSNTRLRILGQDVREQIFNPEYMNKRIGIMNFANAFTPGGGFLLGANAQEEAICRSSYLYPELLKIPEFYDISTLESKHGLATSMLIDSKNVKFIANHHDKYVPVNKQKSVQVITVAAPDCNYMNMTHKSNQKKVHKELKTRMTMTLRQMKKNQDDVVILGAFGCGIFKNNPETVASIWKELLSSPEFKNSFEIIIMAMYNKDCNYQTFRHVFKNKHNKILKYI